MESWSFVSGGKGFVVSNEITSPSDTFPRSSNKNGALIGWDLKSPCSFSNNLLVSGQQSLDNNNNHNSTSHGGFGDFNVHELVEKQRQTSSDSIRDVFSTKLGDASRVFNPIVATTSASVNAFSGEEESISRLSSSVVDSNNSSRDSPLIDLKLGRLADQRDASNSKVLRGTPPKRGRVGSLNSQVAYCQVYGCNKDLSASKDYHKRHKVCEIHSKTPKVIVNGIEQRFCQQCSRFHLLAEFDDGKKSCRKRLAGHNERRRKPQVGVHYGRSARFLQSCNGFTGSRFPVSSLAATSFFCQDILRGGGLSQPESYGTSNLWRNVKVEPEADYNQLSAVPFTSCSFYSKSLFHTQNFEKPFPSLSDNRAKTTTSTNLFNESNSRYAPNEGLNSGSRPMVQASSIGSEDFALFDSASTIHGISGNSESGCALSLLSSQSHNSSTHSSGIPLARPIIMPGNHTTYISDKLVGVGSQASTSAASNKYSSSGLNSGEGSQMDHILASDGSEAVNFDITDGIYHESSYMNAKDRMSCENGTTVDLLQLSSQLQRVDSQRHSVQLKQENDDFSCLRIT